MISRQDVEHVARLSRLALSDAELERMREQLSGILAYIDTLRALDTAGVEPTAHPIPMVNVLRPDVPRPGISRDEVLAAAPAVEDGRFRVPRILGEAP